MNENKRDLLAIVLICLAILSVYLNSLPNTFIFDDRHMIINNNYIKNLRYIPVFFKDKVTSFPIAKGMFRPLLMLTFVFNYFTSGLMPQGYHLINILIHFLNAVFLYLFLKLLLKDLSFALRLGIVLIFSLHPINTEAVTYVSSRSDLLSGFFILGSLYAYIHSQRLRRRYLYLFSLALYILAFLSKETGLVIIGLIIAYEFVFTEEIPKNLKRILLNILPFLLIGVGYLFLRKYLFGAMLAVSSSSLQVRSLSANILTQSAVSFYYLYLFLFPFNLCIDHYFPIINSFSNPLGSAPLILIIVLVTACLFLRKRLPIIIRFSCLWYFICLLPKFYARLNLVCAEHQAYLAYFGLYFLLGFSLTKWRIKRIYLRQLFFFILGLFFLLTLIRNFQWRSEYSLWKSTLKVNPQSGIAKASLGVIYQNRGFLKEAEILLEEAASTAPLEKTRIISLLNLATLYVSQGNLERGLEILENNKDYLWKSHPFGYLRAISFIHMKMNNIEKAKQILEKVINLDTERAEFKVSLGYLYLNQLNNKKLAKEYFQGAIDTNPDLAIAHYGLGVVLEAEDLKEAINEYNKAIKLAPNDPRAYYKLGLIYTSRLRNPKAECYLKKTIQLSPTYAPGHYGLAALYLSLVTPDYARAQEYYDRAKSLGHKADPKIEKALQERRIPK